MTRATLTSLLLGIATALACVATSDDAMAYCRTAGCEEGVGALCEPAQPGDCGIALTWSSPCISYSLQAGGTSGAPFETTRSLVRAGFDAWMNAECGGTTPGVALVETATVECGAQGYDQDGGRNANLIVFRDDDWPYSAKGVLALTTLTYGLDSGLIYDADMEFNSQEVAFSYGDEEVSYDFLSVVTHEAGHFLGLAHSSSDEATMVAEYKRGTTDLRSLSPDDVAGICATYAAREFDSCAPSRNLPTSCPDGTSDDGDEADGGTTDEGCAVARGGTGRSSSRRGAAAIALLGAALIAAAIRKKRPPRASHA